MTTKISIKEHFPQQTKNNPTSISLNDNLFYIYSQLRSQCRIFA